MRRHPAKLALAAALLVSANAVSPSASADVAPPAGIKYARFQIQVQGLDAHPDHVLLVFPHSLSNGAPTAEIAVVEPGKPLSFGRRIMGQPKVYAMRKDAWEKAKGSTSELPATGTIDCNLELNPRYEVKSSDPDVILDSYKVAALDDQTCRLDGLDGVAGSSGAAANNAAPAPEEDPAPAEESPKDEAAKEPTKESTAPPANTATSTDPNKGGCAACEIGATEERSPAAPFALLGLGALIGLKLRRRSR